MRWRKGNRWRKSNTVRRRKPARSLVVERLEDRRVLANAVIVDNLDPGFNKNAGWSNIGGAGYSGTIELSNHPFNGDQSASWSFNVAPGTYRVAATWHGGHPAHGSNVPIEVRDGSDVLSATTLNQQLSPTDFFDAGVGWKHVGVFRVDTALTIDMTDAANGYAVADAFRVEPVEIFETVIDNLSSDFSKSGVWANIPGAGYASSIELSQPPFDGSAVAQWQFDTTPGAYRISATWHGGHPAHGSDIPVKIYDGSSLLTTLTINQQLSPNDVFARGVWWEELTTVDVAANLRIELNDAANGYAVADAFRIERIEAAADALVVDNLSDGYRKSGIWANIPGAGYTSSIDLSQSPFDGNAKATWDFNNQPGTYRLAATWHGGHPAHAANVPIAIYDGSTLVATTVLNQQLTPDDYSARGAWWEEVGVFDIASNLRIEMTDNANGHSIADAFRIERISTDTVPILMDDRQYHTDSQVDLVVNAQHALISNDVFLDSAFTEIMLEHYPQHGQILTLGNDGSFTYRPDAGYTGIDTFTYRAFNDKHESATAEVSIAVGMVFADDRLGASNTLNRSTIDPWLMTSTLEPPVPYEGFGQGRSNVPERSSALTEGGLLATGGLQLIEDVAQGMGLVYRSDSIERPIIEIETTLLPGTTLPTSLETQLTFNGTPSTAHAYDTSTLASGQAYHFALQADGSQLPTGMYDYSFALTTTIAGVPNTQVFAGQQAIIGRSNSEFGEGWFLEGLDRLYDGASGVLIVRGNGDHFWFPSTATGYLTAEGDTSRSRLVKLPDGSFSLTSKTGLRSTFSSLGLLTSRSDPNGNTVTYAYADQDNDSIVDEIISLTDPFGRVTTFGYNGSLVSSITHFSGKTTTLTHTNGDLTSYSLQHPTGSLTVSAPSVLLDYDDTLGTLQRTSATSELTLFAFDQNDGRLRSVTYGDGGLWTLTPQETTTLPPNPSGNAIKQPSDAVANVTDQQTHADQLSHTWTFETDRLGYITRSITPLGNERTYERNADGLVVRFTEPDPDGSGPSTSPIYEVAYSGLLSPTFMKAADGAVTRTEYSAPLDLVAAVIDPVGRTTSYAYDNQGNPTAVTDGDGFTTVFVHNPRGQVSSITPPDPDGPGPQVSPVTQFAYDQFARLQTLTHPDASTQSFTYNSADQILSMTDELGKTASYVYDNLGRLTSSTNRVGATNDLEYDNSSRIVLHEDPLGYETHVSYNNRGWVDQVTLPDPDGPTGALGSPVNTITYDFNGNVLTQGDPAGLYTGAVPTTYDDDNRLKTVGSSIGSLFETYHYDAIGRVVSIDRVDQAQESSQLPTTPVDEIIVFYDAVGRMIERYTRRKSGGTDWFRELFRYNEAGELVEIEDGQGNISKNEYNGRGQLVRTATPDPDGTGPLFPLAMTYAYDNMGRLIEMDRGFERRTTYEYNNRSWLTKVTEADPDATGPATRPVTQIGYNSRGDQTSIIDPLGRVTGLDYDDAQRLIRHVAPDPDGAGPLSSPETHWTYNLNDWNTSRTDAVGAAEHFTYDALGRLLTHTSADPDGAGSLPAPVTQFEYAAEGLSKVTDPLGAISTFSRDARGRIVSMVDVAGQTTSYEYNFYDRLLEMEQPDPDGPGPLAAPVTSFNYDPHGRLESKIEPLGTTIYQYDLASNLASITDPNNNTTTFSYDGWNRVITETNSLGKARGYTYDVGGNLARTVDRNGKIIQFDYDNLDRLTHETWTGIDQVPQVVVSTLVQGSPTASEQQTLQIVEPGTGTLAGYWYAAFEGEVTSALAPYASAIELEQALEQLSTIDDVTVLGTITTGFTITFGGSQALTNVDQLGLDGTHVYAGIPEHVITSEYNSAGELIKISEPSGVAGVDRDIVYTRDGLGRTTSLSMTLESHNLTNVVLDQTFDAVGNRTRLAATLDGTPDFQNDYAYDQLRRLTEVTQTGQSGAFWVDTKRVAFDYNSIGQRTAINRFESLDATKPVADSDFTYDSANRLATLTHSQGATTLNAYSYGYDLLSRLVSVDANADGLATYGYDTESQVVSATYVNVPTPNSPPLVNESYIYDANGNRDGNGFEVATNNRTSRSPENVRYEYDDEGNLVLETDDQLYTTYYSWDHRNRLTKVHRDWFTLTDETVEFEYDVFNRLHRQKEGNDSTYYVYDEGINPVIEYGTGPRKNYLWSDVVDELLASEDIPASNPNGGDTLWALADHLGSIRDIVDRDDSTGVSSVVNHRRYNSFGEQISESNPSVDLDFGFTGKLRNETTGLQNNLNRWYDPTIAKWISEDPIGFAGGDPNLYRYVGNGPLDARDPSGLVITGGLGQPETPWWLPSEPSFDPSDLVAPIAIAKIPARLGWRAFVGGGANRVSKGLVARTTTQTIVSPAMKTVSKEVLEKAQTQLSTLDNFSPAMIDPLPTSSPLKGVGEIAASSDPATIVIGKHPILKVLDDAPRGPHSQIAGQIDSLVQSGLTGAKRLRPDELATGRRLERLLGRRLRESAHEGAEFVDDFGRTFDALGGGSQASRFFNSSDFSTSITRHLRKSNDFTVIDLTGFTPSQITQVRTFLNGLSKSELDRIIRIGF